MKKRPVLSRTTLAFLDQSRYRDYLALAAKFARNGFWPTGDNRASQLFFFSFWVFLIILYPIPTTDMLILLPSLAG
jgi:hypothetical protein